MGNLKGLFPEPEICIELGKKGLFQDSCIEAGYTEDKLSDEDIKMLEYRNECIKKMIDISEDIDASGFPPSRG